MLESWIWLAEGLGYGAPNTGRLLAEYPGGPADVLENVASLTAQQLVTPAQAARLASTRPQDYAAQLERAQKLDVDVLCYADKAYPERLRSIHNPPLVLYCKGKTELLNGYLYVGIVGARKPTAYGVEAVDTIGKELAQCGAVIVSGLAEGLDAQAHKAALAVSAPTIACVAFGHGYCYPAAHRGLLQIIERYGLSVSEYPPGTNPRKVYFLHRNRMIAGLSHGVMVGEARLHSGTMSTVNFAAEWGRDVLAVPGSIFSPLSAGTHALIKDGAVPVCSTEDVLALYLQRPDVKRPFQPSGGKKAPPKAAKPTPEEEKPKREAPEETLLMVGEEARAVYAHLGPHPVGLAHLCEKTGLVPGRAMAALTELELVGLSRQMAGRQFILI